MIPFPYVIISKHFVLEFISAAEERAGRLSRNNEEKKTKEDPITKSTELKVKKPSPTAGPQMKRSQSTPRVNSILKLSNSVSNGMSSIKNGITNKTEKKKLEKKSVTIVQNGYGSLDMTILFQPFNNDNLFQ